MIVRNDSLLADLRRVYTDRHCPRTLPAYTRQKMYVDRRQCRLFTSSVPATRVYFDVDELKIC